MNRKILKAMKEITVKYSNKLEGTVKIPGDKSISHRALIFGSMAEGTTKIRGLLESEDVKNTANALSALGAVINKNNDEFTVEGIGQASFKTPENKIYLGNSGTSARLLMGLIGGYNIQVKFIGDKSLNRRPMERIITPLEKMGVVIKSNGKKKLPLQIIGKDKLKNISYEMPIASAQVKSAIILAALHAEGTTTIIEALPSRNHTEIMLAAMGVNIKSQLQKDGSNKITVEGFPKLKSFDIDIPSDPSSAAFITVATLITQDSDVTIPNVLMNKTRIGLYDTLIEMGANISFENQRTTSGESIADIHVKSSKLHGVIVPPDRVPSMIDEFPILSVAASFADGKTSMNNLAELRVKESDRLASITNGLSASGVKLKSRRNGLIIYGDSSKKPKGGCVIESNFDHRIAMSFAIMGLACKNPITIHDTETISTSFPNFIDILKALGADVIAS